LCESVRGIWVMSNLKRSRPIRCCSKAISEVTEARGQRTSHFIARGKKSLSPSGKAAQPLSGVGKLLKSALFSSQRQFAD
jgi:hypothetical protein